MENGMQKAKETEGVRGEQPADILSFDTIVEFCVKWHLPTLLGRRSGERLRKFFYKTR